MSTSDGLPGERTDNRTELPSGGSITEPVVTTLMDGVYDDVEVEGGKIVRAALVPRCKACGHLIRQPMSHSWDCPNDLTENTELPHDD